MTADRLGRQRRPRFLTAERHRNVHQPARVTTTDARPPIPHARMRSMARILTSRAEGPPAGTRTWQQGPGRPRAVPSTGSWFSGLGAMYSGSTWSPSSTGASRPWRMTTRRSRTASASPPSAAVCPSRRRTPSPGPPAPADRDSHYAIHPPGDSGHPRAAGAAGHRARYALTRCPTSAWPSWTRATSSPRRLRDVEALGPLGKGINERLDRRGLLNIRS